MRSRGHKGHKESLKNLFIKRDIFFCSTKHAKNSFCFVSPVEHLFTNKLLTDAFPRCPWPEFCHWISEYSNVTYSLTLKFSTTQPSLIDLFSLYVLFSLCRSCDDTLKTCFLQIFSYSPVHVRIIYEKTKGKILSRPSLGKQNIQAKEGYSFGEHFDAEYNCIGILQYILCHFWLLNKVTSSICSLNFSLLPKLCQVHAIA